MAQTTAVVRNTLTATLAGTTDFTSSGFGTPSAAIIVVSNANTTNNPQAGAVLAVGFWAGTDQRTAGLYSADAAGTSGTQRMSDDSYGLAIANELDTVGFAYSVTSITDGIRLTLDIDGTGVQRHCTVMLIKGVSSKLITFTTNPTVNTATTSVDLGFAPKLLLLTCVGTGTADINAAAGLLSFGVARASDSAQYMTGFGSQDGQGTTIVNQRFMNTRCVGQVYADANPWNGEITAWSGNTFEMTTREGGSLSDVCFVLALGGDVSFDIGELTTRTTTGTEETTTTVPPNALLVMSQTAIDTTLQSTGNADGICIGMSDGTNDYSHNATDGDNLDVSNCQSEASTTKIIDLDVESAGFSALVEADVSATSSTSFTLNYTTVSGTARKGWWLAFGDAPAAGGGRLVGGKLVNRGLLNRGRLA